VAVTGVVPERTEYLPRVRVGDGLGAHVSRGDGIRVLSTSRIDSRLLEVTVRTPALAGPANVRVLLPSGQDDGGGWCTNWFNGGAGRPRGPSSRTAVHSTHVAIVGVSR
jgi:hypothetical protein